MNVKRSFKTNARQIVFLGGMLLAILVFFVAIFFTRGQALINILHQGHSDTFMDLFNIREYSPDAYLQRPIFYPPLAWLCNGFFAHCLPEQIVEAYNNGDFYVAQREQASLMMYLLLLMVLLLIFSFFFKSIVGGNLLRQELSLWCILLSVPFIFTYERANLILIAIVFSFGFVWGYDSKNKWIRGFSYLCLALAAAVKVYPAVLGLILVKERRWKSTGVLAVVGATVFLLPFFAFDGGITNLHRMINNLSGITATMQTRFYGLRHDLKNFLGILTEATGVDFGKYEMVTIIVVSMCILLAVVFRTEMPRWKAMALLCSLTILIPGFSYTYTLTFMAIPLALFLKDTGCQKTLIMDCIYAVLFLGIFMPLVFPEVTVDMLGISEAYRLTPVTLMENIALIGMVGCILVQEVVSCIHEKIGRNPQ